MSYPEKCDICPRRCGADRINGTGICGGGRNPRISKIMVHRWEEPCICGDRGTGAVFFSGCALRCIYCQNKDISGVDTGKSGIIKGDEYDTASLAELFCRIADSGVATLDLVTPSHYAPQVREALDRCEISVPVVYNISGYELTKTIRKYMDRADVFLTDFKYGTTETAEKYSSAADYPETASESLREMYRITGDPIFDDEGILRHGIVLRHLVLPGERKDSVKALERAAAAVPPEKMILSLMRQYTPGFAPVEYKNLGRRVTTFEYEYVRDAALGMGFAGYSQDADSATVEYTPEFEKTE